jgi:hypothetical protein
MQTRIGILFLVLVSSQAGALCHEPLPRLVCAEYFRSKAVVIAKLAGITRVKDSYGDVTGTYYSMTVERTLRGDVPRLFRIYEANDSGRAAFIWDVDESYLLFLQEQTPNDGWLIDGCGNSGPSELRGKAIRQVEAIDSASAHATIAGAVGGRSSSFPLAGVQVEARGPGGLNTAETKPDGTFEIQVASGKYQVLAVSPGRTFMADDLTYEDPDSVVLENGGCAQVQFVEVQKHQKLKLGSQ